MHRINCHLLLEKLLDSGLSSCAAQRFEFLLTLTVTSETKTWSPKKQVKLVLKLDSVYALIGFLTLYKRWETKSWPFKGLLSPKQSFPWSWSVIQRHGLTKKKEKNCFRHWTVFMRWSGFWLCTRDGRLNAEPLRGQCHPKNIFLSLDLWCKDLVLKKRIILFQPLNCLYELIGCLTLYKRWETKCWSFKGSVSPKKSLPYS